ALDLGQARPGTEAAVPQEAAEPPCLEEQPTIQVAPGVERGEQWSLGEARIRRPFQRDLDRILEAAESAEVVDEGVGGRAADDHPDEVRPAPERRDPYGHPV